MALIAIVLFVVVAMLVYTVREQTKEEIQILPASQEEKQQAGEPADQVVLDSLSVPAQSEELDEKITEDEREILDSLSVSNEDGEVDEKADEETLKSLEIPVK